MTRCIPEQCHNLSLRLSEVLDDIGVNERMVEKWRRSALLMETARSILSGYPVYIFGSRSEGTSTIGLNSDTDKLYSLPGYYVIQDYSEWKPGLINLLMIRDDNTSPGYCQLQLIRPDRPLPVTDITDERCLQDEQGRILMKNTIYDAVVMKGVFKNGPARTREGLPDISAIDEVCAMSCESWPIEARDWSQRCLGKWPTENMKRYTENSGCFVVPVGSKISEIEELEWRISTSRAERCLMFSLNITQIRCFVLLKMILKTYLQHPLSSYMCKTVLLRCIEKTNYEMWQAKNLFSCLTVCLQALYGSVLYKSCPHYFIPGNNLMARKVSPSMKGKLLKSLHHILEGQGSALYEIQTDELGERLEKKMNPIYHPVKRAYLPPADDISLGISGTIIYSLARNLFTLAYNFIAYKDIHFGNPIEVSEYLMQNISDFLRIYQNATNIEKEAVQFLVSLYSSNLGSVLASMNAGTNQSVSPEALNRLSAGLNSDVSSGRLKLASVLYCSGDMVNAESVLRETDRLYRLDSVMTVCGCYQFARRSFKMECFRVCKIQNEKAIKSACAFCVRFFPAEMNCIPRELQYELFRSTKEELLHRDKYDDCWMKMAVVDSLPYFYFLQYKTYGNLQRYNDQQKALEHLALAVNLHEDFGHKETAFNLLGQCYEQENRLNEALVCYTASLNVRETNNVARYHLCGLLSGMLNNSK